MNVFDRSAWPEAFKVPPTYDSWTTRALRDAKVPNNPPRAPFTPPVSSASDITACRDSNSWALTYDDGPGSLTMDYALKPLRDRNITATFYVTGQQVAMFPEILRQMHNDGHSIGIHTWSHKGLSTLSNAEIVAELVWTSSLIYSQIGLIPSHVRPPFADIDERSRAVIEALGFKIVLWNLDTNDWQYEGYTPGSRTVPDPKVAIPGVVRNYTRRVNTGTISLQHDFFPYSAAEIPTVLDIVRNTTYKLTTVPECAGFAGYGNPIMEEILRMPRTNNAGGISNNAGPSQEISQKNGAVSSFYAPFVLQILIFLFL